MDITENYIFFCSLKMEAILFFSVPSFIFNCLIGDINAVKLFYVTYYVEWSVIIGVIIFFFYFLKYIFFILNSGFEEKK